MRYFSILIFLVLSAQLKAQKLVKQKVAENISLSIPAEFYPMSDEDKILRYQSTRLPIALYTDPERLVELGINRSYSLWQPSDLQMMADFYEASILELYDKVKFVSKGIKNVNKHDFVYFEFESVVYPQNEFQRNIAKYTYLMYGLQSGTTYLFNFTCELSVRNTWQSTTHKIMESVKLK